jgi:type II secretory pathway component GspD/PulD (secretin)
LIVFGAAARAQTNVPVESPDADASLISTNGSRHPEAIIPSIVMDEVALTDAIKNLARAAGLNYMLDPKVAYGQPGADGKTLSQPLVTLRWENVTAEQALAALLANYNLLLVPDLKTKIARITTKDPTSLPPLMTKIIQLRYADATNIVSNMRSITDTNRSRVSVEPRTSQLVVVATEAELVEVDKLVARLDTPTKQVLIEARLVETTINPTTSKGIDWTKTLQAQNFSVGNNLQQNSANASVNNTLAASPMPRMLMDTSKGFNPATAFLDADGVSAVLSFLNTYAEAKVLSSPRTVTLDNEPAHISVTRASPIFNITAGTANTTGGSQIQYTNLGVILHVTPRISANNYVNLKVTPEVSRIFDTVTRTVGSEVYQADEYDVRRMETRVLIPSGNTLVLGGMVQDDVSHSSTKVPLLGDIPYLGSLFRSETKSRMKTDLIIFVTPTIVQESDYHPTKTEFLTRQIPQKDSLEADWSAWDSGKPAGAKGYSSDTMAPPDSNSKPAPSAMAKPQSTFSELPEDAQK